MLATINDMPNVTFLAGADRDHVVPEVAIPALDQTGCVELFSSEALEGRSPQEQKRGSPRRMLFEHAMQLTLQYLRINKLLTRTCN